MLKRKKENLYFAALTIIFIYNSCYVSKLINLNNKILFLCQFISVILLLIKVINEKYSKKNIKYFIILGIIMFLTTLFTSKSFFIINLFIVIGIKNIDIKKVLKLDILIKSIFLLTHIIIFFYDYNFNYEKVENLINLSKVGLRITPYLTVNGSYGMLVWMIIDFLYLKYLENKTNISYYIIGIILCMALYVITKSRTGLIVYIIYLILMTANKLLKEKISKFIHILSKTIIPIIAIISIVLVVCSSKFVISKTPTLNLINELTTNRLRLSTKAYDIHGITLFPRNITQELKDKKIILDNLYIRCIIEYGIIIIIILSLLTIKLPKNKYTYEKIIFILFAIYMYSELFVADIGRALPILIIGNIIINKGLMKNEKINL